MDRMVSAAEGLSPYPKMEKFVGILRGVVQPTALNEAVILALEGWVALDDESEVAYNYSTSKYEDTLSEVMFAAAINGWEDDLIANESLGCWWLFTEEQVILRQTDLGFIHAEWFESFVELQDMWAALREAYDPDDVIDEAVEAEEIRQATADHILDTMKEHGDSR